MALQATGALRTLTQQEQLNFLLTNRIPRHALTRFVGWLSRIRSPGLTRLLIAIWRSFTDLDFADAEKQRFDSLQDCFTRRLKPGARPIDGRRHVAVSPCDAIVGECGRVQGTTVFQAKGFPYELGELMPDVAQQRLYRDGTYVTLRLRSSFYHRFHAPLACDTAEIQYISGDTWNVNPVALARIRKLYCRNERAVIRLSLDRADGASITLVPVAAILVASMRFTGLRDPLDLDYAGPNHIPWRRSFAKGEEMGYFQQGSTIVVFATSNFRLAGGLAPGSTIRMGEPLLLDAALEGEMP